jgi:hypothetical protein
MSLAEIIFPYRAERSFGIVSFSLLFLVLLLEAELIVFVGLGLIGHRIDLFIDLQPDLLPAGVLVSLIASSVFAWRARAWTKARIRGAALLGSGAATTSYVEKLAARAAS